MSDDKGYNGWTNHSTWCVKLWMDNEERSYRYWQEQSRHVWRRAVARGSWTRRETAAFTLADLLKDEFEEAMPEVEGVWQDLLVTALADTNWDEIAKSLLEEEDDEEEENDDDAE
jgi:hypothetical protein